MNADERIVEMYLGSLSMGEVRYEPDGQIPPDFAVAGQVAIEVRRLNQHYEADGGIRGLEQDSIPLRQSFENLLEEFAGVDVGATWFVLFNFRRPLTDRKGLKPRIRMALRNFLNSPVKQLWTLPVDEGFTLTILQASTVHSRCLLFGGYTDMDSGGWVVSEVVRNASAYMVEKARKVAPHLKKYPVWWLIFVDYIGTAAEEGDVRRYLVRTGPWDRVLILNPRDMRAYEV